MPRIGKRRQETDGRITYKVGRKRRVECICKCMVWSVTVSLDGDGLPVEQLQQADGREHTCRQLRHNQ